MRQIVLDTETTGLDVASGHRVIEIGCVEVINRKLTGVHFHQYINPEREVDIGAFEVHGISNEFLSDKPTFAQIANEFVAFLDGSELVIHNAPFDLGFLNSELARLAEDGRQEAIQLDAMCSVVDTLTMARKKHPGQRNSLDALCQRYGVDNSSRDLHGALLDAEILADVYLTMTGGQATLVLQSENREVGSDSSWVTGERVPVQRAVGGIPVIRPTSQECKAHEAFLDLLESRSDGALWRNNYGPS